MEKMAKLASLGVELNDLNDQAKTIEEDKENIKIEMMSILKELNQDLVFIELGEEEAVVVKNNKRTTKAFDKDSLSSDFNIDKDKLDYAGIAEFTEKGKLQSHDVAKYQKKNDCEFITVRMVRGKKKGRD